MERIGIIGGNTLIGKHLISEISSIDIKTLLVWDEFETTYFDSNANNNNSNVSYFIGSDNLVTLVESSDIVFNLFEIQDFSLIPNNEKLEAKNVEFVENLVRLCKNNSTKLIHLSSVYLQCSTRWPNIYGRENIDYEKFRSEVPFPAYCDSKNRAEQILKQSADCVPNICARVGAVYGEGDRSSVICDAILFSQYFRILPKIGDESGTFQMSYAGNVAAALLKCAQMLSINTDINHEIVLITDETPTKNIYESILHPLCRTDKDLSVASNESQEKEHFLEFDKRYISFYFFFPLYWSFSFLAWCWAMIFNPNSVLCKLPSPYYPYIVIHQWTFYNNFKLRIFFNHKSKYDFETSLSRSRSYYQQLDFNEIKGFSWLA